MDGEAAVCGSAVCGSAVCGSAGWRLAHVDIITNVVKTLPVGRHRSSRYREAMRRKTYCNESLLSVVPSLGRQHDDAIS
jgi:hypothetical protein